MRTTALLLATLLATTARAGTSVTVAAGKFDRADTVVTFPLPAALDPKGPYGLVRGGETVPVQVLPGNQAAFVLRNLRAGQSLTFSLDLIPQVSRPPLPTDVVAKAADSNVTLSVGGHTVFRYNGPLTPLPDGFEPAFQRGGYLFPILTPAGRLVCDDYPPMHRHHHGVWFAWTSTQFENRKPDFWNMGLKKGRVEFVGLGQSYSGPIVGGLSATHRYVDLTAPGAAKTALNETWAVTAYGIGTGDKPYFVFDVDTAQTCATDAPLMLPQYHYGGIAFRGHRDWNAKSPDAYAVLTSDGKDRTSANESTARWVHMGGAVDGQPVGLAMLGHPSNFRAPQPLRVHTGEPYFCYAPQVGGEFSIEPGKSYVSRYRLVVADGAPDAKLLDRLWNDYASPPEVAVK